MSVSRSRLLTINAFDKTKYKAKHIGYDIYDQYLVYGLSREMDKILRLRKRYLHTVPDAVNDLIIEYIGKRFASGVCKQGYLIRDGIYKLYHKAKQWAVLRYTYLVFYDMDTNEFVDKYDMLEYKIIQISKNHHARFKIIHDSNISNDIVLQSESIKDMYDWIQHLTHAINILKKS